MTEQAENLGFHGMAIDVLSTGVALGSEIRDLYLGHRCTMHRRNPFASDSRRALHRTQVQGQSCPAA